MPSRMPRPRAAAGPSRGADWPNSIRLSETPTSEAPGSAQDAAVHKRVTANITVTAATASRAASAARRVFIDSPYLLVLTCLVGGQVTLFLKKAQQGPANLECARFQRLYGIVGNYQRTA